MKHIFCNPPTHIRDKHTHTHLKTFIPSPSHTHTHTHTHTCREVLGYKYLPPCDNWGGHSSHLTGQVHLCPGDIVNTLGWGDDHRSWEKKTREDNLDPGQALHL